MRSSLPIRRDLTPAYTISLVIAPVMFVTSLLGLLYGSHIYAASQVTGNTGTDALTLFVGLPILLGSMWFARRGSLIGLLCWPGGLFYILYVYAFYVLEVPFNWLFLPYVVLVAMSMYTTIGLVASIDGEAVRRRLNSGVPVRTIGAIFILIAVLFIIVDAGSIITSLASHSPVDTTTRVSWVADFTIQLPAELVIGILMWRREAFSYVAAPGLLLQAGVLNAGFAIVQVLQARFAGAPINMTFDGLVFGIGAISIIFLGFFVRSAATDHRSIAPKAESAALATKAAQSEQSEGAR